MRLPQDPTSLTGARWADAWNPRRQQYSGVDGLGTEQGPTAKKRGEGETRAMRGDT